MTKVAIVSKRLRAGLAPCRVPAIALVLSFIAIKGLSVEQDTHTIPAGLSPVRDTDFYMNSVYSEAQIELGRLLFFDKVLSGNQNISCATCHHPDHATADGLALGIGEGGVGLGPDRFVPKEETVLGRVPRNSPALHFRGAREFSTLFHDGRVEVDSTRTWPSGFWTPAREQLPEGLDNVLAAQAMFPVLSDIEMAGARGENPIANAAAVRRFSGEGGAWDLIAERLRQTPGYVELFRDAYPHIESKDDIKFVDAANALAVFQSSAFRPDGSPFDTFLRTQNAEHMSAAARRGMNLFYGEAGCSACHAGKFQTDHQFHSISMPQIGPGKGDGTDDSYFQATGYPARLEDFGRAPISGDPSDRYRFRTSSLRNVELSGPWGHSGAFTALEDVVRHHMDPKASVEKYRLPNGHLPQLRAISQPMARGAQFDHEPINPGRSEDFKRRDGWVQSQPKLRTRLAASNVRQKQDFDEKAIQDLVAFLKALTDPRSRELDHLIPDAVPSGLPVTD